MDSVQHQASEAWPVTGKNQTAIAAVLSVLL